MVKHLWGYAGRSALKRHQIDCRVLASSINLYVEFQTVALAQLTHARALYRADMHESVGLAVVAGDEAEALHGIEELDRAGGALAGERTLRGSGFALGHGDDVADDHEVARRDFAAAINQREFQPLTLGQAFQAGTLDRADVHEHILAAILALDEAETLLAVEKLDDALALANDLGRHAACATTAAAAARAAEATTAAAAATRSTAAEAAAITTAEAATIAAAETTATAATAEAITTATETVTTAEAVSAA